MDKKKMIAVAAATLAAGVLSTQGLHAMTDYCDLGSGGSVRSKLLNNEEPLAACKDGKCPRPKRPKEGSQESRYNWRSVTAAAEEGKTDEGSCGEGTCGGDPKPKPEEEEDKSDEGSCGEGTCG